MSVRSIDVPVGWVAARTNSKSGRERTQSQGANELEVAARTNSKSRRERTQREVSFDQVERETFLFPQNPGRWRSRFGFAEWELFLKACQNPLAQPVASKREFESIRVDPPRDLATIPRAGPSRHPLKSIDRVLSPPNRAF